MTIATAHEHNGSPGPRMLLSVADVAAELGCGRDTVYRLMTSGALPSVILGGRLRRVRREDLRAYVESLAVTWPAAQ
jgi:excisionase family DNA binding protein